MAVINNQIDADERIADAVWFLKGFAAAGQGDGAVTAQNLAELLTRVRRWLFRISDCQNRLLGTHERTFAVVLTEGEFERLVDGIGRTEGPDFDIAKAVSAKIFEQIRTEQRAFADRNDPNIPF